MNNNFRYNKFLVLLFFLLISQIGFAQSDVEMADLMRESGKIYVVVAVLLVIFIGIVVFLFSLDRKIRKIEKEIEK